MIPARFLEFGGDEAALELLDDLRKAGSGGGFDVGGVYWCSPIVLYITYWHGQLDIIPTCFLVLSVFCAVRRREVLGAVLLGLGVAAKSHILVAAPFLALYLWRQRSLTSSFRFLLISGAVYLAILTPVLGSPAFRMSGPGMTVAPARAR